MIPPVLLMPIFFIGFLLWLICLYSISKASRYRRRNKLLTENVYIATGRFANTRRSLMEANEVLRQQLDQAESAWGDANVEINIRDKMISELCQHYKKINTQLQDLQVTYNHLVGKYNSLMDKFLPDGEMPT